ncbi:MAG: transcription termination/antitermination protein NusA, partial [Clostridia bacterium]|nr:transcription termination/antitermination protein NusA [Clostridia bacterium]
MALDLLESEKKIPKEVFIETLENALALAYKKQFGNAKNVEVVLVPERSAIRFLATLTVVEEVEDKETQISLEDAKLINKKYKVGDKITEEIDSKDFGRIVAQNAKQVI